MQCETYLARLAARFRWILTSFHESPAADPVVRVGGRKQRRTALAMAAWSRARIPLYFDVLRIVMKAAYGSSSPFLGPTCGFRAFIRAMTKLFVNEEKLVATENGRAILDGVDGRSSIAHRPRE